MERFTCEDISAVLSALLDGELDRETAHLAEIHLADCGACRGMLDEAEENDALLRASMTFDPRDRWTSELETHMLTAVLNHRPSMDQHPDEIDANQHDDAPIAVIGPRQGARFVTLSGWMTAAAAVMVMGIMMWQNSGLTGQPTNTTTLATNDDDADDASDESTNRDDSTSSQLANVNDIRDAGDRLAIQDTSADRDPRFAPALAAWFPSWMPVDQRADWALGPVFPERAADPRVSDIVRDVAETDEPGGFDAESDVSDLFAQTEILLHVLANSDADEIARVDSDVAALIEEEELLNRLDDVRGRVDPGVRDDVNRAYYVLTRANTARDADSVSGLQRTIEAYDLSDRMAVLSEQYAE